LDPEHKNQLTRWVAETIFLAQLSTREIEDLVRGLRAGMLVPVLVTPKQLEGIFDPPQKPADPTKEES